MQINTPRYGNTQVVADTFDELRALSSRRIEEGYSAIVAGALSPADGFGGMLVWRPTSTVPDDNQTVIAPQDGSPGRWHKIAVGQVGPQGPVGIGTTGSTGPSGPANSTYTSLTALRAADPTHISYLLATSAGIVAYAYQAGDFTGKADDASVVQLNAVPISAGALVRQGAATISDQVAASAPIQTQARLNGLQRHLFQYIDASLWPAIMARNSSVAVDDQLDAALADIYANYSGAELVCAGTIKLNRPHIFDLNKVTPLFDSIDMSTLVLPVGSTDLHGITFTGQSSALSFDKVKRARMSVNGPLIPNQPSSAKGWTGVWLKDIDNAELQVSTKFWDTGVANGANAYIIRFSHCAVTCALIGLDIRPEYNSCERMTFDNVTFASNVLHWRVNNANSTVFFTNISADYPSSILGDPTAQPQWGQVQAGRVWAPALHSEGAMVTGQGGSVAPYAVSNDSAAQLMLTGEFLFSGATNQYLIDNGSTNPVWLNGRVFNIYGPEGGQTGVLCRGRVRGYVDGIGASSGPSYHAGILSREENKAWDGSFEGDAALSRQDWSLEYRTDGSPAPIYSDRWTSDKLSLTITTTNFRSGGKSLKVSNLVGGAAAKSAFLWFPLSDVNGGIKAGFEMWLQIIDATGPLYATMFTGTLFQRTDGTMTVGRIDAVPYGAISIDLGSLSKTSWTRLALAGGAVRSARWAKHAWVQLNMDNAGGSFCIDDVCLTEIL